ncbi:MAG: T9SS type A sorting domain-containing protein, partial [Chitinophagaceae bacterium]
AVIFNHSVNLDWSVLCRQEADRFTIERSSDGTKFTDVHTITGRLIINETESYSAIDNVSAISSSVIYYRLRTLLKNGRTSYSNILTVRKDYLTNQVIQIFPNPVKDHLQFSLVSDKNGMATILIIDASGKSIRKYKEKILKGNNTYSWNDMSGLSTGIYYLKIDTGEGVLTAKFNVIN